jgi:hypothetical protein
VTFLKPVSRTQFGKADAGVWQMVSYSLNGACADDGAEMNASWKLGMDCSRRRAVPGWSSYAALAV